VYQRVEGVDRWVGLPEGLWPDRASELDPSLQQSWASGARARLPQLGEVYTARRRLEQQVAGWWQHTDIVMTPAAAIEAFGAEGPVPDEIDGSPVHPSACLIQPILPSLCNLPAVSVPVGLTSAGLPAGMQIIAPLHREDLCLRLAYLFEQAVGWPVLPSEPWIR
jgi:Asp-tRNA(Asn)/Glu-tRNA(Gln) amidotransferase A subunit family amidase